MMRFKKLHIVVSSVFLAAVTSAGAFDFGGLLTNDSVIKTCSDDNFRLDQKNSASLWIKTPFSEDGQNYFIAEALYNFERDFDTDSPTNALDFDLFKLAFAKKAGAGSLGLNAGRFRYSDLSGTIFSQTADGLELSYKSPSLQVSLYGSYTGLLNFHNVKMISSGDYSTLAMTKNRIKINQLKNLNLINQKTYTVLNTIAASAAPFGEKLKLLNTSGMLDAQNIMIANKLSVTSDAFIPDTDRLYDPIEKYVVGSAAVVFPNLFAGQNLGAQFLGAFRVEKSSFNRMYATLSCDGPIKGSLYYGINSTLGFTQYDGSGTEISNLSKLAVMYYSNFHAASLGFNAAYASCSQNGFECFHGISQMSATYALQDLQYSGLVKFGMSATIKPVPFILLLGGCDCVITSTDSDERDCFAYSGMQYIFALKWQVASDFLLGANVTQYLAKDGCDDMDKTAFTLSAALSF